MTAAVKKLLASFERLTAEEQREATLELLKRSQQLDYGPLPDEALIELAERSFLEHDAREAADGKP